MAHSKSYIPPVRQLPGNIRYNQSRVSRMPTETGWAWPKSMHQLTGNTDQHGKLTRCTARHRPQTWTSCDHDTLHLKWKTWLSIQNNCIACVHGGCHLPIIPCDESVTSYCKHSVSKWLVLPEQVADVVCWPPVIQRGHSRASRTSEDRVDLTTKPVSHWMTGGHERNVS